MSGNGEVIVDVGIDAAAEHPAVLTIVGPTFDPEEFTGRNTGDPLKTDTTRRTNARHHERPRSLM